MTKTPDDPILDAAVECAVAPLAGLLPPDLLEEERRSVRLGLTADPEAQDILRRLRARPLVGSDGKLQSGKVASSAFEGAADVGEEPRAGGAK